MSEISTDDDFFGFPDHVVSITPPAAIVCSQPSLSNMHPMTTRAKTGIYKPKALLSSTSQFSPEAPTCFSQAVKYPQWRTGMVEEYNALIHNNTWELVLCTPLQNPVGCKWVFRIKYNSDGSISHYKARLVAKGYHQVPGYDYSDTFSPVAKPTTIRLLLSLAVSYDWKISQLDVSNAFLHGTLQENVYLLQPPGFTDPLKPLHVCKLRKSIYGLKQAPRAWYEALHDFLDSLGFNTSYADHSLFVHKNHFSITAILIYVDDILLTGSSSIECNRILLLLQQRFAVKNLGDVSYFLGLQITRTPEGMFISQEKYAMDLLRRASMLDAKPTATPFVSQQ